MNTLGVSRSAQPIVIEVFNFERVRNGCSLVLTKNGLVYHPYIWERQSPEAVTCFRSSTYYNFRDTYQYESRFYVIIWMTMTKAVLWGKDFLLQIIYLPALLLKVVSCRITLPNYYVQYNRKKNKSLIKYRKDSIKDMCVASSTIILGDL